MHANLDFRRKRQPKLCQYLARLANGAAAVAAALVPIRGPAHDCEREARAQRTHNEVVHSRSVLYHQQLRIGRRVRSGNCKTRTSSSGSTMQSSAVRNPLLWRVLPSSSHAAGAFSSRRARYSGSVLTQPQNRLRAFLIRLCVMHRKLMLTLVLSLLAHQALAMILGPSACEPQFSIDCTASRSSSAASTPFSIITATNAAT